MALIADQDSAVPVVLIADQTSGPTSGEPPNDTTPKATVPKAEVSNAVAISGARFSKTYNGDQFSVAIS